MPWTASTSRVSSPYQPCGSQALNCRSWLGSSCRNWPGRERRLPVLLGVGVRVLQDRRRGVRVSDRDGHALAGVPCRPLATSRRTRCRTASACSRTRRTASACRTPAAGRSRSSGRSSPSTAGRRSGRPALGRAAWRSSNPRTRWSWCSPPGVSPGLRVAGSFSDADWSRLTTPETMPLSLRGMLQVVAVGPQVLALVRVLPQLGAEGGVDLLHGAADRQAHPAVREVTDAEVPGLSATR